MVIYFLRHANAGPKHFSDSAKDEKRPIDKIGEEQSHDMGRALAAIGVTVSVIISSPLTRAMQTAAIVSQEIGHEEKLVLDDALRPEATFEQFKVLLNRYKDKAAIMVVGHDPSMTEFVNRVLSGGGPLAAVEMKKGGVAKVVKDLRRPAVLKWSMPPKDRAEDSAEFGEEVTSEDGLKVDPLLFDRPELQFDSFRSGRCEDQTNGTSLLDPYMQFSNRAATCLVERTRQAKERDGLGHLSLVRTGHHAHHGIAGSRQRLANKSRNGSDDAPLHRRVPEDLGMSNDVVGVATAS
jgi:phosphohistidine phosphatase